MAEDEEGDTREKYSEKIKTVLWWCHNDGEEKTVELIGGKKKRQVIELKKERIKKKRGRR